MAFRRCQIRRKILHYHEEPVYIHVVSYLESRVRVVNADAFKQCSLPFDGRFFVTHVQRQALARNLSTIHVHSEVGQIVMAEIIRVRISRTEKVCVLYDGEIRRFGRAPNTALLMDRAWGPPANVKVLNSTLVTLYRAMHPLLSASVSA